ncbi:CDK5 regulatory subunit-associated protein 3 [Synchiropus splendidus]|uniref:CDK5 regulatory subunit-associated protein 3 n=1 Tax=Synchiropus splendidus TaxID=270530 RepID=UPI00237DD864|nr:CDK5 regulatory subunit-associated protein 3 [Synchiropus splendidus]
MENIQNLPIDIQSSKLLDWLLDRRHCNIKWQGAIKVIREKINAAIQDMPENDEIKHLLSGSYIHYFHCLQIIQILKGTEASSKNFFGRYSSQRMKDWQEIVSLYEVDSVYLAEVASLLIRNVSYEGPALRKQIAKAQQQQQEFSRKEVECQNSAVDLRERYYVACKEYGIKGENVTHELQALVKDLPVVLDEVAKDAVKLEGHLKYYTAFTNFVCQWSGSLLPMLTFVLDKGNITFYEWRTGTVPTVVERPVVVEAPPETMAEDTIDWGDFGKDTVDTVVKLEEGIDWGISLESNSEDAGGIDWGDGESAPIEIEVTGTGIDCPEGVARGEDALSILETAKTRGQFIDDLNELEVFLTQRLREMAIEDDIVAMNMFQMAPSIIHEKSQQQVKKMLSEVQDLLGRLTSQRMQHLFMIQASPRYVERVSEVLRQKMKQADILALKSTTMVEKRQEALEEQARLEPRVELLAGSTRELQKLIEGDISKRYNNRPVNLMGVHV